MKKILLTFTLALISLSLVACSSASGDDVPTTTEAVKPQKASAIELYGKVAAKKTQQLALNQTLQVEALHVQTGMKIKKGDILATLNIDVLKREQALLEAEIKHYKKQLSQDNSPYLEAVQRLKDTKARSEALKRQLATQKLLFEQGSSTKSEYDAMLRESLQLEREIESNQVSVNAALQSGAQTRDNIALNVAKAEASLSSIIDTFNAPWLKGNQIICQMPIAIVETVYIQEGQMVPPNTPYFSLVDVNNLVIRANASEDLMKHISIDQIVTVTPLMDKGRKLEGKVVFISSQAEQQGGETSIPIEIELTESTDLPIKLNVDVEIPLK